MPWYEPPIIDGLVVICYRKLMVWCHAAAAGGGSAAVSRHVLPPKIGVVLKLFRLANNIMNITCLKSLTKGYSLVVTGNWYAVSSRHIDIAILFIANLKFTYWESAELQTPRQKKMIATCHNQHR